MDHAAVARRVLEALDGADNIKAAAHCATRLRLVLDDSGRVNKAALENDPDLKGIFEAGGMFQIIVGPGDVDIVYTELVKLAGVREVSTEELKDVAAKQGNAFSRAIKVLADIFVPLIPILVGGGLLMAINNILTAEGLFGDQALVDRYSSITDLASFINVLAAAPFAFLPILVGFSATKRFGGNPYLGAGMAMAMVMPSLVNGYSVAETIAEGKMEYWNLFGLHVAQAGYQGTVLPILLVAWILSVLEKFLHSKLRGTTDFLVTPLLTLLITGFVTFIAVGPAMRWLGDEFAAGLQWVYDTMGPVGGFLFGLVYSPIVITGLHQSFPPVELQLFAAGGSFIFATASMANIAQGGATLAVALKTKDEKLKGLATASGVSACFGITEPAIFGVNLRLRWPFYIAMGASAVASALVAVFKVKAVALGAAGIIGFVSIKADTIPMFFVCLAVSFLIAFIGSFVYATVKPGAATPAGADEDAAAAAAMAAHEAQVASNTPVLETLASPLTGKVIALNEVKDAMFAGGKLGPGAAIVPTEGVLRAPASGTIKVAYPTGHAFAIATDDGVEVLMHIGFDTVNMKGDGFSPKVTKGDRVEKGQVLCEFDIEKIKAAGYDTATPVVVSNYRKTGAVVTAAPAGDVTAGDNLLQVHEKEAAPAAN
ncbi:MAG: sucrose-specific PTS transporter subunit IIBC [Corynebacterium sp.]|nr:sucrose-specific PTS transporter subunit IIBC [Corynebacterium sp.]